MTHNSIRRWTSPLLGTCLALGIAACSPGSADSGSGDDDDRNDQLGILCEGAVSIQGTFTASMPQPADVFGCWPVGTWKFKAIIDSTDCDPKPMMLPEYQFSVVRDAEENESYVYDTDPTYERVRLKVTSGGGGLCEGGLEIYSMDGKTIWNFKPALQADGTLNGIGEIEMYGSDQW
jgi:hypothetical protein